MAASLTGSTDAWNALPQALRSEIEGQFEPEELLLVCFEPDLDQRLQYANELVALTNRRLISIDSLPVKETSAGQPASPGLARPWKHWRLDSDLALKAHEASGVGTLELIGPNGRLGHWRYTSGRSTQAGRLAQRFAAAVRDLQAATPGGDASPIGQAEIGETVCPACGAVLTSDQTECPACVPASIPPPARTLYRLIQFARPRAGMIILGGVLTLASTAAGLVPPYLTMPLLDKILIPHQNGNPADFGLVKWYLLGLAGAALVAWLLGWARTYVLAWVSEQVSVDLRNQTYGHLQKLSLEFFGGKRTGDLMSRVGSDTDRICNFLSMNLLDFVSDVLMIVLTAIILFTIDPLLALVTLLPFPAIAWLIQRVRTRLRHGFGRGSRAWSEMISVLADTIPGIRVVKAFAQERRETDRFFRANEHVKDANNKVNKTWAFFGPMVTLLTESGLLIVWACGAWRVAQGYNTVGELTAFLAYIARFYTRLDSMSRMITSTQRAAAASHRIFEILDRVPTVQEPVRPVHPGRVKGAIELRRVVFRYGSRTVLHGINLSIQEGEMIGLVGHSGAGKSTLVNLVCRFFDVAEGAILVDGTDIRSYPVAEYRRNIGIVLQDPFLFYGTIAENISYGRPEATRKEIIAAARAARAHDFILRLTDGYDSLVGERGQSLSGGERQRISIARALLIAPRILILDEATSSVDTETEREIQAALDNLIQGRTTIAIAHRLSTLRRANRLVVLEHGQISEVGHHFDLLKQPGTYARLHQAQLELAQNPVVL